MAVGVMLEGRYKIRQVLGQGGMSTVYLAEDIKLGTYWAIKQIPKNNVANVYDECDILKRLNHPALPRVTDIIEDSRYVYVVVDYIGGETLSTLISQCGGIPEPTVVEWAGQLCDVLSYLHNVKPNPIIYRDMKPSNIILTPEGKLKLIDFGISREFKKDSANDTVYIGTRGYAAPEQYGEGQTSASTDIYSLGVTLHYLLTGKDPAKPPYELKPVRHYNKSLSKDIEKIIDKCTRHNSFDRYQTADELAAALNALTQSNKKRKQSLEAKDQVVAFKKLVLTIWANAGFACELGYTVTGLSNHTAVIINLDFASSTLDSFLDNENECLENSGETCFDELLEASRENRVQLLDFKKLCKKAGGSGRLHILTAPYSAGNIDKYKELDLSGLIELSYNTFDLTVIIVNPSLYDTFSIIPQKRADFNIAPIAGSIDAISEYERYLLYMSEKYGISVEKAKLVAWEYKKGINLPFNILQRVLGGNSYIGYVNYDSERERQRNLENSIYAKQAYTRHSEEYTALLSRLNIIPVKTFKDTVKGWLSRLF